MKKTIIKKAEPVEEKLSLLFKHLSGCIMSVGLSKTTSILSQHYDNSVKFEDERIESVVSSVCDAFSIKSTDLIHKRYVRGEQKVAIGFIVYYLYENYSLGEINRIVFPDKDKGLLTKYRQIIEKLDNRFKNDAPYITIKRQLDTKLKK